MLTGPAAAVFVRNGNALPSDPVSPRLGCSADTPEHKDACACVHGCIDGEDDILRFSGDSCLGISITETSLHSENFPARTIKYSHSRNGRMAK